VIKALNQCQLCCVWWTSSDHCCSNPPQDALEEPAEEMAQYGGRGLYSHVMWSPDWATGCVLAITSN